jgi:hypothetical protein
LEHSILHLVDVIIHVVAVKVQVLVIAAVAIPECHHEVVVVVVIIIAIVVHPDTKILVFAVIIKV